MRQELMSPKYRLDGSHSLGQKRADFVEIGDQTEPARRRRLGFIGLNNIRHHGKAPTNLSALGQALGEAKQYPTESAIEQSDARRRQQPYGPGILFHFDEVHVPDEALQPSTDPSAS